MKNKKGLESEVMVKWMIALGVLILVIIGIATQKDKLLSILQRFSEILRFR